MKKIMVAVVMLFGIASAANATVFNGKLEIGGGGFDAIPVSGDFKDHAESELGWNVFADYEVMNNISVGLEYGQVSGYDIKDTEEHLTASPSVYEATEPDELDENYLGIRARYMLPFEIYNIKAKAYGLLGIARYEWKTDPDYAKDNGIGFSLGLGLNVDITEHIFAGAEARYHFAPKFEYTTQSSLEGPAMIIERESEKLSMNYMSLGLQVGYRF